MLYAVHNNGLPDVVNRFFVVGSVVVVEFDIPSDAFDVPRFGCRFLIHAGHFGSFGDEAENLRHDEEKKKDKCRDQQDANHRYERSLHAGHVIPESLGVQFVGDFWIVRGEDSFLPKDGDHAYAVSESRNKNAGQDSANPHDQPIPAVPPQNLVNDLHVQPFLQMSGPQMDAFIKEERGLSYKNPERSA